MFKQSNMTQKKTSRTACEFFLCWPSSSGHGACPVTKTSLQWRKLIFPFQADIHCKKLLSLSWDFVSTSSPCCDFVCFEPVQAPFIVSVSGRKIVRATSDGWLQGNCFSHTAEQLNICTYSSWNSIHKPEQPQATKCPSMLREVSKKSYPQLRSYRQLISSESRSKVQAGKPCSSKRPHIPEWMSSTEFH